MDNNHSTENVVLSVSSIVFAYISAASVKEIVSIAAGMMAVVSGFMAARYYYFSVKKLRK